MDFPTAESAAYKEAREKLAQFVLTAVSDHLAETPDAALSHALVEAVRTRAGEEIESRIARLDEDQVERIAAAVVAHQRQGRIHRTATWFADHRLLVVLGAVLVFALGFWTHSFFAHLKPVASPPAAGAEQADEAAQPDEVAQVAGSAPADEAAKTAEAALERKRREAASRDNR